VKQTVRQHMTNNYQPNLSFKMYTRAHVADDACYLRMCLRPTRHTRTREKPEEKTATPHTDSCANLCVTVPKLTPDWVHFLVDIMNGISLKHKFLCYCILLGAFVGWCTECKGIHDTSNITPACQLSPLQSYFRLHFLWISTFTGYSRQAHLIWSR
jgi:hypothetical protein